MKFKNHDGEPLTIIPAEVTEDSEFCSFEACEWTSESWVGLLLR